jgi:hypothetical protein
MSEWWAEHHQTKNKTEAHHDDEWENTNQIEA